MLFKEELTASAFIGGLSVNYHIEATANQLVLTDKGRKTMKEVTAGDNLYVYDGITGKVTMLKTVQITHDIRTATKVYTLVTSKNNYPVNRAVVLNK
jgi:preprotein translocase subunit SecA